MAFGFLKGSKLDLSINLERPTGPFYPGDTINATVTIHSEGKVKVRQGYAGLVLWEKYKYKTQDSDGDVTVATGTSENFVVRVPLMGETEIPAGFHESLLAIHHPGAGPLPELLHSTGRNVHDPLASFIVFRRTRGQALPPLAPGIVLWIGPSPWLQACAVVTSPSSAAGGVSTAGTTSSTGASSASLPT